MHDAPRSHPSAATLDARLLRATMAQFATGVTVISYLADGAPAGMTANAFMSVSLEPPLVLVSVRAASRFHQHMQAGVCYGVNFLADDQRHLSGHFGGRPVDGIEPPFIHRNGTPLLDGSLVHLVARTVDVHPAGDHLLYIAQVEDIRFGSPRGPLLFYGGRYHHMPTRHPVIDHRDAADCC
ncbi:flavin reductase family protein [Cupriavidus sp. SZY C1]|nr:flavin reductase family protein [Cupriavidus sp. SZY C1]MDT6961466.1 flavin reductase family protein [Cupriavidus sp. SZY C1]